MKTKLDMLKEAFGKGDYVGALRIANKFPDLGEHKAVITRAYGCITNPRFFKQIGVDCDAAVEIGKQALVTRYNLGV